MRKQVGAKWIAKERGIRFTECQTRHDRMIDKVWSDKSRKVVRRKKTDK